MSLFKLCFLIAKCTPLKWSHGDIMKQLQKAMVNNLKENKMLFSSDRRKVVGSVHERQFGRNLWDQRLICEFTKITWCVISLDGIQNYRHFGRLSLYKHKKFTFFIWYFQDELLCFIFSYGLSKKSVLLQNEYSSFLVLNSKLWLSFSLFFFLNWLNFNLLQSIGNQGPECKQCAIGKQNRLLEI